MSKKSHKGLKQREQAMAAQMNNVVNTKAGTRHETQNEGRFNLPNQPSV